MHREASAVGSLENFLQHLFMTMLDIVDYSESWRQRCMCYDARCVRARGEIGDAWYELCTIKLVNR